MHAAMDRASTVSTRSEDAIDVSDLATQLGASALAADLGEASSGTSTRGVDAFPKPPLGFGGSRLRSLLEVPLQRVGAYESVAVELQLACQPTDPSWAEVTRLLHELSDLSERLSVEKEELGRISRLRSLTAQFKPGEVDELLAPNAPKRSLVHSGLLQKSTKVSKLWCDSASSTPPLLLLTNTMPLLSFACSPSDFRMPHASQAALLPLLGRLAADS